MVAIFRLRFHSCLGGLRKENREILLLSRIFHLFSFSTFATIQNEQIAQVAQIADSPRYQYGIQYPQYS